MLESFIDFYKKIIKEKVRSIFLLTILVKKHATQYVRYQIFFWIYNEHFFCFIQISSYRTTIKVLGKSFEFVFFFLNLKPSSKHYKIHKNGVLWFQIATLSFKQKLFYRTFTFIYLNFHLQLSNKWQAYWFNTVACANNVHPRYWEIFGWKLWKMIIIKDRLQHNTTCREESQWDWHFRNALKKID